MITSGEAGRGCSLASLSVVLLSLSLSEPELLSEPLWLLESSLDCSAASLLLLLLDRTESKSAAQSSILSVKFTLQVLYMDIMYILNYITAYCLYCCM